MILTDKPGIAAKLALVVFSTSVITDCKTWITDPAPCLTPVAVACDEAVNLANKYSDMQGRKFINGVLRRLQTVKLQ